jgi:outer membrane protein
MNVARRLTLRLPVLITFLSLPGLAAAASIPVSTSLTGEAAPVELRIDGDTIRLPLEQAIELALRRNLGLVVERYGRAQARQSIFQNQGIYDLLGSLEVGYSDSQRATASRLDASNSKANNIDLSLSQLLPSGATVAAGWANSRAETDSIFADLNPSYRSTPAFSIRQPLLRDFGRLATERNLMIARTNDAISREQFETQVAAVIQQTENAYWDLVEAREQLKVAEESLALTRELHDQNRIRVEVGTLAPLELVQSEAGIATREEGIIRARSLVGDAEDSLRRLLALEQGDLWEKSITPETSAEQVPLTLELAPSIATALRERPELASQRLLIANRGLDAQYYGAQRKPRLDVSARYGYDGVGGTLIVDPQTGQPLANPIRGGFGDAFDQVTGLDFPSWSLGVSLAIPIQNRAARAQSTIADLELEKAKATLKDLEQTVVTEVRRAARAVDTAREVIASARVSSRLAEKNLDAERKRYENGMSTSFQILEIQEDLTSARSREVTAVTGYRRALAEFHRAIGRLLEENGVSLDDEVQSR